MFLLGDTNFNVMDTSSSQVRRYSDIISELNMVQLVTSPTHLSPTPSALDHVITNMREPAPEIEVLPDVIGDHQPVIMRARLGRVRREPRWRTQRGWRRVDWNAICHDLLLSDWSQVDGATDVDGCVWNAVLERCGGQPLPSEKNARHEPALPLADRRPVPASADG